MGFLLGDSRFGQEINDGLGLNLHSRANSLMRICSISVIRSFGYSSLFVSEAASALSGLAEGSAGASTLGASSTEAAAA